MANAAWPHTHLGPDRGLSRGLFVALHVRDFRLWNRRRSRRTLGLEGLGLAPEGRRSGHGTPP